MRARHALRPKPRGIDQQAGIQNHVLAATFDLTATSHRLATNGGDLAALHQRQIAQQRQHILMAVDDAGGR